MNTGLLTRTRLQGTSARWGLRALLVAGVLLYTVSAAAAAGGPQPPRVAGAASSLVRYGYFTAAEFFPVDLRRVSDFPVGFGEFDPGKDFGVVFVGAVEAPGRTDFKVRGVLRKPDGTPLDSFVEVKKFSEHASWYPIRRVFAMERLRSEHRGKWELELFVDDRPVGKFPFDVVADPLWAQRPKKDPVATAQAPPKPTPPAPPQPGRPTVVKLELIGPPNARVKVDGGREQILDGRGRLEVSVAPGPHRIEVDAPGYKPYAGDVTLAPDRSETRHTLALTELPPPTVALVAPAAGSTPVREDVVKLRVEVRGESLPSAVRLMRDGKVLQELRAPSGLASNQPWIAESSALGLLEGDNRVTVEAIDEFGRRASQTFTIAREHLVNVELKLEPDARLLVSSPDLKKELTADRSGKVAVRLLPGDYRLEASKPGFRPTTEKLTVKRGPGSQSHAVALSRVPAPSIAVLDPKSGATVQADQATLKVEVKSGEKLGKLKVSVGGARAQMFDPNPQARAGETWVVSVPVRLAIGENQISLEASDQHGQVSVATMTLTREDLIALELNGPAGAEVRIDQKRYVLDGRGVASITLKPGAYDIEATKDGFDRLRDTVTLKPGERVASHRLGMQVAKVTPPPAPAPPPPPPPVVAQPAPKPEPPRVAAIPPPAPAPPPARVDPPKIQFSYPPADAKLERERTPVIALVTDEVGITEVELTVNGEKVPTVVAPKDPTGKITINAQVVLTLGDNVFAITAMNKAGKADQVIRIVSRTPPVIAGPPPPPPAPKGERYAVVIGVGVYDNPQIPRLRFAENDARAMYNFLTTKGQFKKDNVLLVTDTAQMKPTLTNIKRALGEWLYKKSGKDDTVLVYYAGHGAPEVDASGTDRDGLSKYLIPRDADPESLFVTGFAMDDIETIFRRLQSERVVFAIDTCFSGSAGGRTFARQATRSGHMTNEFLERLSRSKGRIVISASGPNELALELPELKHGLFTYYLLKGMEGEADADKDRLVTVNEIFNYVQKNVSDRARQENGKQSPVMSGAVQDLPLVEIRP
ncbi:MAG: caspase family protein [Candidatus Rokubacteria bacterium]|nr:caspase family protein [Candidatus Rokubacteria bacterium]